MVNIKLLIEPFALGFMQRGLAIGLLIAVICGLLGCFVVLRGMEFIGDAISHAILPGVVVAFVVGGNVLFGGVVAGLITALIISFASRSGQLRENTIIGVVFTGALALGVVIISATRSYTRDLSSFLFGNILGITTLDLVFTGMIAALVVICMLLFYKELALASFDPTHATKIGIPVQSLRTGLLILLTLSIVAGAQSVGTLMVTALLITPAAAAGLVTRRLPSMMLIAAVIAAFAVTFGLVLSYQLDLAPGATIVLVASLCFGVALFFRRK